MPSNPALKAVAVFEASKGLVALAAASGLLLLVHRDLHELALRLVEHTHLNPAAHYPGIFIEAATHLQNARLALLAAGAALYATVRFVEAYGLYRGAAWAEVLAAVGGAIYVPFEVAEVIHRQDGIGVAVLAINLAIVGVAVRALLRRRGAGSQNAA
ncbi:DUF2127 domain-containing protein [Piscinibacter gummiphilus]|uniref:Uncharacterized protein n=1 Tax=Piscinibacter gummiphilus TaxID=946333 RepID=A0A1W6L6D2_9BURK|nr:DUF2127 domain-containing protein [Piscinibacter gummiphilus]ARN19782.1 hypothetical protein A4W93_07575 [Piscinibacter gummiphilus]ATU64454.1 DUF2127 domain-containing protein [Piscinibacter gummiphilus]GLS95144.1 membrane protein [Piscinibacter gummiphilus]